MDLALVWASLQSIKLWYSSVDLKSFGEIFFAPVHYMETELLFLLRVLQWKHSIYEYMTLWAHT